MKWFKHDANAVLDSKLKRLRMKYGMEGYGLYWYCLECVARNVEKHNLTFQLEEDAELIAADTNIHYERVEEMMRYMVDLELFEASEGRVYCLKMATRTDEYTQKILKNSRQPPDSVGIKSDSIDLLEEIEKKKTVVFFKENFQSLWKLFTVGFGAKGSKAEAEKIYLKIKPDEVLFSRMCSAVTAQAQQKASAKSGGLFFENFQHVERWLKKKRWDDEVPAVESSTRVYGV